MQKERIEYFDIAKGIAIILVILGHCFLFSLYNGNIEDVNLSKNALMNILTSIHMPIFIFISGAFSKNIGSFKSYWTKKTKQLILPLFFIPMLYCLISSIPLYDFIYKPYHAGYWFTWALFLMFIPFFYSAKNVYIYI